MCQSSPLTATLHCLRHAPLGSIGEGQRQQRASSTFPPPLEVVTFAPVGTQPTYSAGRRGSPERRGLLASMPWSWEEDTGRPLALLYHGDGKVREGHPSEAYDPSRHSPPVAQGAAT